jgi:hypothetical protein
MKPQGCSARNKACSSSVNAGPATPVMNAFELLTTTAD